MKKLLGLTALILFSGIVFSQTIQEDEMKTFIESYVEAVTDADMSAMDEFLSPGMKHLKVDNLMDFAPWKYTVALYKQMCPDWKLTIDELIIKGDKAVARFTSTGTNTGNGPTDSLPPSGKRIEYSGVTIFYFVDGKISGHWTFYNPIPVLTELGYTITPPQVQSEQ